VPSLWQVTETVKLEPELPLRLTAQPVEVPVVSKSETESSSTPAPNVREKSVERLFTKAEAAWNVTTVGLAR